MTFNDLITVTFSENRPCTANGRKAIFQRWGDKTKAILEFNVYLKADTINSIAKKFEEDNIVPAGATVKVIANTIAIVEFEDGHVEEVEPTLVNFTTVEVTE